MQIVSNKVTLDRIREAFPYLAVPAELVAPGILRRRIAYITFKEACPSSLSTDFECFFNDITNESN